MTRPADEPGIDPYKVLQVDPDAEPEVLQAVFRRLAQKYHPDVMPGPEGEARMIAINAAWEILGDPQKRAAYDRERARRETAAAAHDAAATATAATAAGPSRPPTGPFAPGPRPGPAPRPAGAGAPPRGPETVSRDWSSGRSSTGGGYDPTRMRTADGEGAAGPPPGNPSGSVLNFGRYAGWSLGEIARADLEYLEWLDRMTIGRPYREELDGILRRAGRRRSAPAETDRRGLFRRR